MYKVYLDNQLMYRPGYDNLSLVAAKLKQEVNKSGTFTYTIYPNNICCGLENKMKSIVLVYDDDEMLFRGRVLNSEEGFYNEKAVTCEGELSFLIDSIQRPHEFTGTPAEYFIYLITNHNSQVDEWKQFNIGYITVTDPNDYIARSDSTYMNTKDTIDQKLVDLCGGYVVTRHVNDEVYIDYLAELTDVNEQSVEFGKNLLDLNKSVKGEDVATAVIPLGTQDDDGNRLTVESVNDGLDYVYNESAVEEFGWIFKTVTYDDVTLASNLLTKGQADLESLRFLAQTLEVSAADLNGVDKDIAAFRVGKWTNVVSHPHNLEEQYLTQSRTINLLDPTDSTLVLGGEITGLTDIVNSTANVADIVTNIINTATGTVYAEKIMGVINLMNTSLSAQKDAAQTADIVAILFQDLDPDSATYGAMAIGTQGIQIAKERNELDTDWNWGTAIDFEAVHAEYLMAGILSDKLGKNYWNLDTGELVITSDGLVLTEEGKAIFKGDINTEEDIYVGNNIYMQIESSIRKSIVFSEEDNGIEDEINTVLGGIEYQRILEVDTMSIIAPSLNIDTRINGQYGSLLKMSTGGDISLLSDYNIDLESTKILINSKHPLLPLTKASSCGGRVSTRYSTLYWSDILANMESSFQTAAQAFLITCVTWVGSTNNQAVYLLTRTGGVDSTIGIIEIAKASSGAVLTWDSTNMAVQFDWTSASSTGGTFSVVPLIAEY